MIAPRTTIGLTISLALLLAACGQQANKAPQTAAQAPQQTTKSSTSSARNQIKAQDHDTTKIDPTFRKGNPDCSDFNSNWVELKIEPVSAGTYTLAGYSNVQIRIFDITNNTFDWESVNGHAVSDVVVKGGPNANEYAYYTPKADTDGDGQINGYGGPVTSDVDLHAPENTGGSGGYYGLSHISFCFDPTATLKGKKLEDKDADGNITEDAANGLENWLIFVDQKTDGQAGKLDYTDVNANGKFDPGTDTALEPYDLTDSSGAYEITGIKPGTWNVYELLQDDWNQSYPSNGGYHTVTFVSGETATVNTSGDPVDFGNYTYATKKGVKFHDLDEGNDRDPSEPLLSGWTITLKGTNVRGETVNLSMATSDGTNGLNFGEYEFKVLPGSYVVCEVQDKEGWRQTYPVATQEGTVDCTTETIAGVGYDITLESRQVDSGNDFGNYRIPEDLGGCTPGYWKNHPEEWQNTSFTTGQSVGSVFVSTASAPYTDLADDSLMDALNYDGGDTVVDKARILLRAAVAAVVCPRI